MVRLWCIHNLGELLGWFLFLNVFLVFGTDCTEKENLFTSALEDVVSSKGK
jgi:hypothetical protein